MNSGLAETVQDLLLQGQTTERSQDLKDLQKFYNEKKEQGAVLNSGYTLPQLDTIGKGVQCALGSATRDQ